jgi:hypothetical protein
MIGTKDYAGAQKELRSAALRSVKLGLRVLQAQGALPARTGVGAFRRCDAGQTEYAEARRAAAEVLKEAQTDAATKRSDLAPIFTLKS